MNFSAPTGEKLKPIHTGRARSTGAPVEGSAPSGLAGLEPGARIDRFAALADLEIQLRPVAAAAVAGGGNRISPALTRSPTAL